MLHGFEEEEVENLFDKNAKENTGNTENSNYSILLHLLIIVLTCLRAFTFTPTNINNKYTKCIIDLLFFYYL